MNTAPAVDRAAEERRRPRAERLRSSGASSDALAGFYCSVADDSGQAAKRREAALLFAAAEEHFKDGGTAHHDEALSAARAALAGAQEGEDRDLQAAAARLVVKAHILAAFNLRCESGSAGAGPAKAALADALRFTDSQLAAFRRVGSVHGEASMQLSVAEVYLEDKGVDKLTAALQLSTEALEKFRGLDDKKMEALALLAVSQAHVLKKDRRAALETAEAALKRFQDVEDKFGQAKALHNVATAHAMEGSYAACDEGLKVAQDAMALYDELDCRALRACELIAVADLDLLLDRPKQALIASKEALLSYRQMSYGRGSEVLALSMVVQSHTDLDQLNQALQVAKDGVARFQASGDKRQEALMQDALANAHLERDERDEAMAATQAGLQLCQELQDHAVEARLLLTLALVQERFDKLDDALQAAQDGAAIFLALESEVEFAGFAQYQVARLRANMFDAEGAAKENQLAGELFYKASNRQCEALVFLQLAAIKGMDAEKLDEAVRLVDDARAFFQTAGDGLADAFALYVKAELHKEAKAFDAAADAALERRKMLQELGFRKEEAKSLHAFAGVHIASGLHAEAKKSAMEGLRIARACGDKVTEVHMLLQLTSILVTLVGDGGGWEKQPKVGEEMLKHSRDAVAVARKVAGGKLRAPALFWNAYALNMTPHAMEALDLIEEATRLFRARYDRRGEAHATLLTAQVYHTRQKPDAAAEYARSALAIFQELGDRQGEASAAQMLQQVAPAGGRQQQQQEEQPQLRDQDETIPEPVPSQMQVEQKGLDPEQARKLIYKVAVDTIGDDVDLENDSPLMDMGLDSLSSVSLRNTLAVEFRVNLAASLMFDYPSVSALTEHIVEKCA